MKVNVNTAHMEKYSFPDLGKFMFSFNLWEINQ